MEISQEHVDRVKLERRVYKDIRLALDRAHFAVVSRPRFHVGDLPARLPDLKARMVMPPLDDFAQMEPVILLIDALTADVSSTAIRERVAEGASIAGLVPPAVQQHIEQHGLYLPRAVGRRASDAPGTAAAGGLHGKN